MAEVGVPVEAWCARRLGVDVDEVLWTSGHLSSVVCVRLTDAREVVVKARPWLDRLVGCWAVQQLAAERGYPCPAPLAAPERAADIAISIEEHVPGGELLPAGPDSAALFAGLLAALISLTRDAVPPEFLRPSPPWVAWDHADDRLWPPRDDEGRDLNDIEGPAWLDAAAAKVRELLNEQGAGALVVGHCDWESQNLRWRQRQPHAVHDWDSVVAQPEPAIVGAASAVWPAAGAPGQTASIEQSVAFIEAYQDAVGERWSRTFRRHAWAAGLWVRAFNAKKDAADGGGPQLDRLGEELAVRMRNAGIGHA